MSIHESILDATVFPIHKCAIFCKVKETGNPLRRSGTEHREAGAKKSRNCAETYEGTSHKQFRRLTLRLRKRAIYGWKLINALIMPAPFPFAKEVLLDLAGGGLWQVSELNGFRTFIRGHANTGELDNVRLG